MKANREKKRVWFWLGVIEKFPAITPLYCMSVVEFHVEYGIFFCSLLKQLMPVSQLVFLSSIIAIIINV